MSDSLDAASINQVLTAVQAILARQDSIERRLIALQPRIKRDKLSAADEQALGHLLPAVWNSLAGASWTTDDLAIHAEHRDPGLLLELHHAFDVPLNHKVVGKFLARAAGTVVGDFCLCRVGRVREGALWRVDSMLPATL